jgi:ABC-type antimicrobial peptide transport system permease subunit
MFGRFGFYIKHSLNDLRVNGRRTAFALLCIAAGVGAIVSLQTLGVMIEDTLTGGIREGNRADIRIFPNPEFGSDVDETRREGDGMVEAEGEFEYAFTEKGYSEIQTWFAERYEGDLQFTYQQSLVGSTTAISISFPEKDTDKAFVQPYVIEADKYPLFGEVVSTDGKPLRDLLQSSTDIVLSQNLADDLDVKVGDKVRLNLVSQDLTVTGIVPVDSEVGFDNILGNIFGYYYVDVSAVQYFEGVEPNRAAVIFVGLDNPTSDTVDELDRRLKLAYPYLTTSTTTEMEEQNSQISSTVNDLVVIMGLVSMLIGGIGIVNTMLVIVSRRTTEVAVLKTIGLEPEEVTLLFLVEAILMGIVGSLLGILLGWAAALILKGVAENFIAQSLAFSIAPKPALNGFIVGILVTTIFGFIPTLAAGQIRPANILRPSDEVVPRAGRLRTFAALMVVMLAISLVTQGLIGGLLDSDATLGSTVDETAEASSQNNPTADPTTSEDLPAFLRDVKTFNLATGVNGAIIGLLMSIPIVLGGYLSMRRGRKGRSWAVRLLILWPLLLFGLPILGYLFGYAVPSIIVVTFTFIIVGSLYLLLLLLIWAVGGGAIREFPVLGNLPVWIRIPVFIFFPLWTGFLIFMLAVVKLEGLALGLFLGLLFFIHIPAAIITFTLSGWVLGQLLQRFGFLDLKIALRAMVSTKGRGAATLLALVIGIFTLSVITMLVDTILNTFDQILEDQTGGNLIIFTAGEGAINQQVETILDEQPGVNGYATVRSFEATFVSLEDSEGNSFTLSQLRRRVIEEAEEEGSGLIEPEDLADMLEFGLTNVDARSLDASLPDLEFYKGRQLDPLLDAEPDENGIYSIVIGANDAIIMAGVEVGDLITFAINNDFTDKVTFRIVGMTDKRGGTVSGVGADNYTSLAALGDRDADQVVVVADVDEESIRDVRRALNEIPGVFVLETRLINELINSLVRQFTSFPILVAALSLVVGGIVIANSVALSTMERRREIGIMKAIGLQRERVLGMLLLENGLMGFVGGLIGVGLGVLALIAMFAVLFQGELGDSIPIVSALLLMGLCILIALVAAVLSVWGASGEKPMNVLRYE